MDGLLGTSMFTVYILIVNEHEKYIIMSFPLGIGKYNGAKHVCRSTCGRTVG